MKDPAAADIVVSTEHTIDGRVVDVKRAVPRDMAPAPARYLLNKLTLFLISLINLYGCWSTLASISINTSRFPLRICCCCMCVASSLLSVVQQYNLIRLPLQQLQLPSAKDLSMPFPISTRSFDFSWFNCCSTTLFCAQDQQISAFAMLEFHFRFSLLGAKKHLGVAPLQYGSLRCSLSAYHTISSLCYNAIWYTRHRYAIWYTRLCFSRAYLLVIVGSTRTLAAVGCSLIKGNIAGRQINRPLLTLLGIMLLLCLQVKT
jgi:hypothetical protein